VKKHGHRVIRELDVRGDRRVEVQRYRCKDCDHSFSTRRRPRSQTSEAFEREIARRHVEGRESYRVISKHVYEVTGRKISATSLQKMVERVAGRCRTPHEMSKELRPPKWSGTLHVDEKMGRVRGGQQWWYLAVDGSGDIVDCSGVKELTVNEAIEFLEGVAELKSDWLGVVTDLDTSLTLAVTRVFPKKPHQYCLKHALASIETSLGYTGITQKQQWTKGVLREKLQGLSQKKGVWVERSRAEFFKRWKDTRMFSARYHRVAALRDESYGILFAKDEAEALKRLASLRRARIYPVESLSKVVSFFDRHWDRLMTHHRVPGIPRTNNMAESVNKQIQRRLKTIESFQHRETALSYMNLLIAYLRCKPYTDCRRGRKHLNGKSRLQAAGVKNLSTDWMANCLKPTKSSNR
jgi:transposase-like protein